MLADPRLKEAASELGLPVVTEAVRLELADRRAALSAGAASTPEGDLAEAAVTRAYGSLRPSLRPVINATGVILHTNLGRAPLSAAAIEAMAGVSRGFSNLEYDLAKGERGSRHDHIESLICAVTGAEAGLAVNNNASALFLGLTALAEGRQIPIARGQVVEIGGGFRIPDVMRQSGVELIDVGTTNRVYVRDYVNAVSPSTAALMRVHSSNFRVTGFTESPDIRELATVAHEHGLLFFDDLGSGCLLETMEYGLDHEPTPQESLHAGADLVFFSGDKLLGGPQSGIIAGKQKLIDQLRRHPLARALRIDKASLAALSATLQHYIKGEAVREVPVWRMIAMPVAELDVRAQRWAQELGAQAEVIDSRSVIGGGSLPEETLPSRVVAVSSADIHELAAHLRNGTPAILGRIHNGRLLLDPRTVSASEEIALLDGVRAALA